MPRFRRIDEKEYAAARALWDKPLGVVGAAVCESLNAMTGKILGEEFWRGLRSEAINRLHGVLIVEAKEAQDKYMQQHEIRTDDWTRNTSTGVLLVAAAMRAASFLDRAAIGQPSIAVAAARPAIEEVKHTEAPNRDFEASLAGVSHLNSYE